jgi:hypothetical protein
MPFGSLNVTVPFSDPKQGGVHVYKGPSDEITLSLYVAGASSVSELNDLLDDIVEAALNLGYTFYDASEYQTAQGYYVYQLPS